MKGAADVFGHPSGVAMNSSPSRTREQATGVELLEGVPILVPLSGRPTNVTIGVEFVRDITLIEPSPPRVPASPSTHRARP